MDKAEFEQYAYLPTNEEMDSSQLLVVQEDGTFLCFNRPIQYVTNVDDVKDVLEGDQDNVYDVAPQQLYIDGENSSELISVSDQFILPDGQNNYLIQDDEDAKEVPMEQDEDVQYKEVTESEETVVDEADAESPEEKNSGNCTEITLNDEQYQLLEQKGWILLESCDKTFLLDSSGLHDITADEKLILKLKCELQEDLEDDEVSSTIKDESQKEQTEIKVKNTQTDVSSLAEDVIHYVIEDPGNIEHESQAEVNFATNKKGALKTVIKDEIQEADITPIEAEHDYVKLRSVKNSFVKKQNDIIKLKTKFSFKDIPPEIVLGKFNGKKLVARVVKTERMVKRLGTNIKGRHTAPSVIAKQTDFTGLDDSKFEKLICEAVRGTIDCGVTDVTAAEIVVVQLSRVPAFRPALMERGLIITKVIIQELEPGESYGESSPSLVTGRAMRDTLNNCRFRFMPDMLWRLALTTEYQNDEEYREVNKYDFLHIHIQETKTSDGIIRISITLNKRNIPLHLFKDVELQSPRAIFACCSCAKVYKSEERLRLHQETECMVTENATIDTEEAKNSYTIINTSNNKKYVCNVCNVVYTKLIECQQHMQSHFKQDIKVPAIGKTSQIKIINAGDNQKPIGVYRCKMCNRAYLDASALSKHIVTRHIKQNFS